jgi:hypothetical protein
VMYGYCVLYLEDYCSICNLSQNHEQNPQFIFKIIEAP